MAIQPPLVGHFDLIVTNLWIFGWPFPRLLVVSACLRKLFSRNLAMGSFGIPLAPGSIFSFLPCFVSYSSLILGVLEGLGMTAYFKPVSALR